MTHLYKVGELVELAFGFYDQEAFGTYSIVGLLPTRVDGEPQYRIRGSDDRDRVIGQMQIGNLGKSPQRALTPHNPITAILDRLRSENE